MLPSVVSLVALTLFVCRAPGPTPTASSNASPTPATHATSTPPGPSSNKVLEAPARPSPTIDGVLDPGEWEGAATMTMSDGSSIYSMYTDKTLFFAFDTGAIGAANLARATDAELWILHSSAALESARYSPGATTWELSHGFVWCCRNRTDEEERRLLLDNEG